MSNIDIGLTCFGRYPCVYLALLCEDMNASDSNLEPALRHTVDNVGTIAQLCHTRLLKVIEYPLCQVHHPSCTAVTSTGESNNRPESGVARKVPGMLVIPGMGRDAQFIATTSLIVLGLHLDECLPRYELYSEVSRIDRPHSAQNTYIFW